MKAEVTVAELEELSVVNANGHEARQSRPQQVSGMNSRRRAFRAQEETPVCRDVLLLIMKRRGGRRPHSVKVRVLRAEVAVAAERSEVSPAEDQRQFV